MFRSHFVSSFISLSIILFATSANAQPADSSRLKLESGSPAVKSSTAAQFKVFNDEYVSGGQNYFRPGAARSQPGVSLGADIDRRWRKFGLRLNGRDQYSANEEWNYVNIYEAALQWRPTDLSTFSLGRKKERWNEWEGEWRQGLFQPRYLINKYRNEEAGLAGLFYSQNTEPVALAIGFLPVHIPDLAARFTSEDNRFVSRNPWFNPPAAQFEYRQVVGDIRYSIDQPTIKEATSHVGAVAKLELNGAKNYFCRLAAAYKPMPQFLLGFPSNNIFFVGANEDYVNIRVTPRLAYHTLVSHDSVFRAGAWTYSGSVAHEIPDRAGARDDFTAQQAAPAWITSASVSRALEAEGPYAARAKLGFLKINGGDAPDRGAFASNRTLFERRYQFNEAYLLGIKKPWRTAARYPLETELRIVYDRLQNGGIAGLSAGMNFGKNFRGDIEMDFLGLLSGPAEVEDGFLALYRANDRIGLGLSYVY